MNDRDIHQTAVSTQASNSVGPSSVPNQAERILVTYCTLCRAEIPEARQRRGYRACSDICQREYRLLYFRERHQRICYVCGRRKRKKPRPPTDAPPRVLDPLHSEHGPIPESTGTAGETK